MTQVLGALIVILGVVLAVLGTISTSRQSQWFRRALFLVAALIVGVQSWQTIDASVEEQRIRRRVTEGIRFLVDEAEFASQLEYKMRGDLRPDTKEKLAEYVAEIERWRTRTGKALKERFPNTGADRLFLAAIGDVGRGPIYYEYTRLRYSQTALFAILASVDAFVRREQLALATVPGSSAKAETVWWWPSPDAWVALFTALLALFTLALVCVSVLQWRTLDATQKSGVVVERAYVGLSHRSPGLRPFDPTAPVAEVNIRVKNHGNTPADVRAVSLGVWVGASLPDVPPYAPSTAITAFVTAHDAFVLHRSLPFSVAEYNQIVAGAARLYLLGYVDYIDRFGQRHRHGYARVWDRSNVTNNLVFVTEVGYNYDRPHGLENTSRVVTLGS